MLHWIAHIGARLAREELIAGSRMMRLLGLAKGVSGYGKVRDGLALLSADRAAGGKFMRVIRGVESESEVVC